MSASGSPAGSVSDGGATVRIEAECLRRGWDVGELARRSGVSRTTLYYLRRGTTRQPRASTLRRIAAALQIDPRSLFGETEGDEFKAGRAIHADDQAAARRFDRRTNSMVDAVARRRPALFAGWSTDDWDELYSSFGTGGALNEDGVNEMARRINRRRVAVQRLRIVLETHLADVAEAMIETLFELSRPTSNLSSSKKCS